LLGRPAVVRACTRTKQPSGASAGAEFDLLNPLAASSQGGANGLGDGAAAQSCRQPAGGVDSATRRDGGRRRIRAPTCERNQPCRHSPEAPRRRTMVARPVWNPQSARIAEIEG